MSNRVVFQTSKGPLEYTDQGEGPVVIALHGAMGGYDQSEILATTILPKGYRTLALSRPGYLGSDISLGSTPEEQADLIAELLDGLKIKQALVIAISGGGYAALYFAHRHPQKCSGLILCSTTGAPNNEKIPLSFTLMTILARFNSMASFFQKSTAKNFNAVLKRGIPQEDIREQFMRDTDTLNLYKELSFGMFNNLKERIAGTRNDIATTKTLTYPLAEITVPTLVIHGTEDSIVPFEKHGKALIETIPNAQSYIAERGEHVTIFTHRKEVQKSVLLFLKSISQ